MTPLETAIARARERVEAFNPGTSLAPTAGSADYFELRVQVLGHSYLLRVQELGIADDLAACERLYRAGTVHFGKAAVPPADAAPQEALTPEQEAAVAAAISSGNL